MQKAIEFNTPIQYLKGIGPKRARLLNRLNIINIGDLLYYLPKRYIDRKNLIKIKDCELEKEVTILGKIIVSHTRPTRFKGEIVEIVVSDGTGFMKACWFNRPDLKNYFQPKQEIILSGKVSYFGRKTMVNPYYEVVSSSKGILEKEFTYAGTIIPVYALTEGLSLWDIRRAVKIALKDTFSLITENLPEFILKKYSFPTLAEGLRVVHFPEDLKKIEIARRRLIYEEFFYFELILALNRKKSEELKNSPTINTDGPLSKKFLSQLPFSLTSSQLKVISEINEDLSKPKSMTRLLQGDVGSGKTVVAVYTALIAIQSGYQAAIMVPTEVLAEQHYLNWQKRLENLEVKVALLTGSVKKKVKEQLSHQISSGEVQLVFGTHALLESGVVFKNLGLVVVDEQHRFGVMQRASLLAKGKNPHFLVMTATPIPRTLSYTIYGDLDISTITEKPAGRSKTITKLISEKDRLKVIELILQRIKEGEQVYWVCPLIEESEKLDLKAAIATYHEVQSVFRSFNVGLLHGRMKSAARLQTMEEFRKGKIDILVTTTVIEVGVDIPNATIMVIEHPERFGLAQLHQLRGRIGRGQKLSYCFLMLPKFSDEKIIERLSYFTQADDGFLLAEKDLEIRGPGEFFGTRQHGLPEFKIADLIKDKEILFKAKEDAFRIIDDDPNLIKFENRCIKEHLKKRFQGKDELAGVI